ncbi:cytochrome b-c1 complex subunit 2, mitochondrial-like [Branchiostoma lanceolatum]|uniref:UQCRC2 protein n=1 Tax=Branchiostoma lanceolatum TaxID=7740 RepID=A0A8S4MNK8_BRALA|nr:UQCRC2 [Branchiostoma lanceolatum]
MASRLLRPLSRRLQSTQAAVKEAHTAAPPAPLPKEAVKISKLSNGMVVASLENNSPVSRVALYIKAGSRYETLQNLGVSHALRLSANLSTKEFSAFRLTRGVEVLGGSLEASGSREHMVYKVDCLRDEMQSTLGYLASIVSAPIFKPWEVSSIEDRMAVEMACVEKQPGIAVSEMVHAAAYRDSLGNSLYAPEVMVGKHTPGMLTEFMQQCYTSQSMALVGLGTDHDTLVQLGEDLFSVSTGPPADKAPAKYVGGVDSRTHIPGPISTAAIVTEGSSLNSTDLLSLGVLQRLLGAGPYVKWGSDIASSRLNRGVAQATQMPFSTTCFNANYTDSGLFGLLATAPAEQMGTVLKAAVSQYGAITKGDVQDADVQRAKSQLKAAVLMSMEDSANVLEDLALQAVETAAYVSPDQVAAQVDSITTDQIVKVAKRVFNGKPTMASLGDLSSTPHLDQLV